MRQDNGGQFWETLFDVVSVVASVVDVVSDPSDVGAWVGLALDVVDVVVPFVGGLGETARAINGVIEVADAVDDMHDVGRVVDVVDSVHDVKKSTNVAELATTGTPNEIGKYGERLAGIDPRAKVRIEVDGRTRIPDALTDDALIEVKNVKYISNTAQLRDFATYANDTGRKLELYVRPNTKVAHTVIDAGWHINYLW